MARNRSEREHGPVWLAVNLVAARSSSAKLEIGPRDHKRANRKHGENEDGEANSPR